jgi:glycerol-3-phosphate dehydrogenase
VGLNWLKVFNNFKFLYFYVKFLGETIENILKTSKGVIEGLPTLEVIFDYAKEKNLDMPIVG